MDYYRYSNYKHKGIPVCETKPFRLLRQILAESEETLDFVNGIKIDLRNRQESHEKLEALFASNLAFSIDNTQLLADYSFKGCLDKFNRIIKDTANEYKIRKT